MLFPAKASTRPLHTHLCPWTACAQAVFPGICGCRPTPSRTVLSCAGAASILRWRQQEAGVCARVSRRRPFRSILSRLFLPGVDRQVVNTASINGQVTLLAAPCPAEITGFEQRPVIAMTNSHSPRETLKFMRRDSYVAQLLCPSPASYGGQPADKLLLRTPGSSPGFVSQSTKARLSAGDAAFLAWLLLTLLPYPYGKP